MDAPTRWYFGYILRKPLTPWRAGRAIAAVTTVVTIACGLLMRLLDSSEFGTVGVALWWAVQTVTTVGYGDVVPHATAGRVVAAVLMLIGIGFLTVITATITAALIETFRRRFGAPLEAKLDEVNARLERLEALLGRER
jgi:voltage-gated potassium channel Kch